MLVEKSFLNLLYLGNKQRRADKNRALTKSWLSDGAFEIAKRRSARKTKNLIGTLLSHGARASRSAQPRVRVSINVIAPNGGKAVKIRMVSA